MIQFSQISKAFKELKSFAERSPSSDLFQTKPFIYLSLGFSQVPAARRLPYSIALPNPFRSDARVCLFCKDQPELIDYCKTLDSRIEKVIPVSDVKNLYRTFEQRRALRGEFDRFICDHDVFGQLTSLLGKTFISSNRFPVPFHIVKGDDEKTKKNALLAIEGCEYYLRGGPLIVVPVGTTEMSSQQVKQNIVTVSTEVLKRLGESCLQRACLKTTESPALPIFSQLPEPHE
ncbi:hypothetical protein RCL1_004251 [Eukaryota sp. TZLM3-RCL]